MAWIRMISLLYIHIPTLALSIYLLIYLFIIYLDSDCIGLRCSLGLHFQIMWGDSDQRTRYYNQNNAIVDFHLKDKQGASGETLEWYLAFLTILCTMYYCFWE